MKSSTSNLSIIIRNSTLILTLTNGAGSSRARARRASERVNTCRIGTSTMMAINGRELAPGLDDQIFYSACVTRRLYMIPAGPRVPPLNVRSSTMHEQHDSHHIPEELAVEERPHRSFRSASRSISKMHTHPKAYLAISNLLV